MSNKAKLHKNKHIFVASALETLFCYLLTHFAPHQAPFPVTRESRLSISHLISISTHCFKKIKITLAHHMLH